MIVPYRFIPPTNGGHKAAFGFCDFVSRERDLICISTNNNDLGGTPFQVAPLFRDVKSKYLNPVVAWRIWRFFRREKITHCITHQPFIALLLLPVFWISGVHLMVYVQNIEFQRFRTLGKWWWRLLFLFERLVYRRADHLFFISPDDLPPAIELFGLKSERCSVVPYGTYLQAAPEGGDEARRRAIDRHGWGEDDFLIIFFGPQTYRPNLEAVERIIYKIEPPLREKADFNYRFLICGGGMPSSLRPPIEAGEGRVIYLGFVEDIESYILASDVMINPVNTGGGVKTKIIEAIALGKTVVSSATGALGVDKSACAGKLIEVGDESYEAFADELVKLQKTPSPPTPPSFYHTYYWGEAVKPVVDLLMD